MAFFLLYDISFKSNMQNIPKYVENMPNFLLLIVFIFLFSSCNQLDVVQDDRTLGERKADIRKESNNIDIESNLSIRDLLGVESSVGFEGSITYQVALDKVSFMPLSSVDSASGIIITDWYNVNDDDLRLKINIRILDENISDNSISVTMFKQSFDGQKWVDQGSDPEQAQKIKKSILDEARVLQATIDLS
tara:strand:+ start:1084 stop:1656 length:573 start_codon:yes stop_codon:yes gene_type:complete